MPPLAGSFSPRSLGYDLRLFDTKDDFGLLGAEDGSMVLLRNVGKLKVDKAQHSRRLVLFGACFLTVGVRHPHAKCCVRETFPCLVADWRVLLPSLSQSPLFVFVRPHCKKLIK